MSPKTIILHIGLPKTGTSFIQNKFFANNDQLHQQNVHYLSACFPAIFHDYGHHVLAIALMEGLEAKLSADEVHDAWPAALDEIAGSLQRHIVISSEWFSFGVHTRAQIERLAGLLAPHDVRVVLCLRDPVDLVNSLYAQNVRSGGTLSIADFVSESWALLNWAGLADRWAAVFGRNNVIAIDYDRARLGNLATTFLAHTIGPSVSVDVGAELQNVTLPLHATEMLREINASAIDPGSKAELRDAIKAFYERAKWPFPPGQYLSHDAAVMLRMHCKWPHVVNRG